MKRGVQGLLTKNKGHIYIYLSILFDASLEVESGQAEFFVFSLPQTCRELCLTLLYIKRMRTNLRMCMYVLCCFGTQTPWFWAKVRLLCKVFGFDDWMMKAAQN